MGVRYVQLHGFTLTIPLRIPLRSPFVEFLVNVVSLGPEDLSDTR